MNALILKQLCKQFFLHQQPINALNNLSLTVERGSFVTIVGKSGCGKTTLLRVIAGLEKLTAGQIIYDPPRLKVSMVFQEPRLMPWLTVAENMALGLPQSTGKQPTNPIVTYFLELLGLGQFKNAYPHQLSGGMAQRVALGRALCYDADIILMDEPLSALDAFTRRNLQKELVDIFQSQQKTILFVTHDIDEALILGQKVLIMNQGSILAEVDVPLPYYRNPSAAAFGRLRDQILAYFR